MPLPPLLRSMIGAPRANGRLGLQHSKRRIEDPNFPRCGRGRNRKIDPVLAKPTDILSCRCAWAEPGLVAFEAPIFIAFAQLSCATKSMVAECLVAARGRGAYA